MRTFDIEQVSQFKGAFPELSDTEFETAMLIALGLSQGEIAFLRDVAYTTVRDSLSSIKEKLNFHSINSLISIFQVRLVLYALSKCSLQIKSSRN